MKVYQARTASSVGWQSLIKSRNLNSQMAKRAVLGALIACFSACANPITELSQREWISRKQGSLGDWRDVIVGGAPLLDSMEGSTALLVTGFKDITVDSEEQADSTVNAEIEMVAFDPSDGIEPNAGSAVPVTEDGYFLTANHVIEGESPTLIAVVGNEENEEIPFLAKSPARIVWRSPDESKLDLALVHAPLTPYWGVPRPAELEGMDRNEPVAVTGWSGINKGKAFAGTAAGKLLSVSARRGTSPGPVWRVIKHSVPLDYCDSGGPLFTREGRLIGVNIQRWLFSRLRSKRPGAPRYRSIAIAPDFEWLQRVIAADRELNLVGSQREKVASQADA